MCVELCIVLVAVQVRVAVASGIASARELIEDIQAGRAQCDFVEASRFCGVDRHTAGVDTPMMSCLGGCVRGDGQPHLYLPPPPKHARTHAHTHSARRLHLGRRLAQDPLPLPQTHATFLNLCTPSPPPSPYTHHRSCPAQAAALGVAASPKRVARTSYRRGWTRFTTSTGMPACARATITLRSRSAGLSEGVNDGWGGSIRVCGCMRGVCCVLSHTACLALSASNTMSSAPAPPPPPLTTHPP